MVQLLWQPHKKEIFPACSILSLWVRKLARNSSSRSACFFFLPSHLSILPSHHFSLLSIAFISFLPITSLYFVLPLSFSSLHYLLLVALPFPHRSSPFARPAPTPGIRPIAAEYHRRSLCQSNRVGQHESNRGGADSAILARSDCGRSRWGSSTRSDCGRSKRPLARAHPSWHAPLGCRRSLQVYSTLLGLFADVRQGA